MSAREPFRPNTPAEQEALARYLDASLAAATPATTLPHTVTVHLPDDPNRPCRAFYDWPTCDPAEEIPGCAAAEWLDNVDLDGMLDGFDNTPVPCPVDVAWTGDCWALRPWPEAVTS